MTTQNGQANIYDMVTAKIVTALEAGTAPWHKGWNAAGALPRSMSTGKPHRGINVFLLAMEGHASPWWGTFDRIAELAGMTKVPAKNRRGYRWVSPDGTPRGVKPSQIHNGTTIIFWKRLRVNDPDNPREDGSPGTKIIPMLRYYRVYNAAQADGLPERYTVTPKPGELAEVASAELVIKEYLARDGAPSLDYDGGNRAYYVPGSDSIHLPERSAFEDADHFYDTAMHELTHSTGHETRCKRPGIKDFDHFGSQKYGKEELCAEMGAAMLAAMTGTDTHFDNSAAYVASWLRTIKGDPKLVVQAGAQAQRAVDHILGVTYENGDSES